MADASFEDPGEGDWRTALARAGRWAGALLSVALVAGVAFWGWRLAVRDVSGVPVIRAMDGQYRVPPEEPGGADVPHQGLEVNRVAAGDGVAPPPDSATLAPEPVALRAEDTPARRSDPQQEPEGADAAAVPVSGEESPGVDPASRSGAASEGLDSRVTAALADATRRAKPADATIPGGMPYLVPPARPRLAAAQPRIDTTAAGGEPAIPPGTAVVQIGALESRAAALDEWDRLAARAPDLFDAKQRVIVGGSGRDSFHKLRMTGFDDIDAAERYCTALKGAGMSCIAVVTE